MAHPTISEVTSEFRRGLAAREHDAQHQIANAYDALVKDLNLDVSTALTALVVADASGQPITEAQWRNSARASGLYAQVERAYDAFAVYSAQKVETAQFDVNQIAKKYVAESFRALIGEKPTSTETRGAPIPSVSAITAFVGAATTPGSALKGLFDEFSKQGVKDIDRRILKGIAKGENPKSIARDITRRAERPVNKARIAAITRTEVMRAQREGTRANFNANKKLIKRWRWSCAKSTRTCIACLVNDGTEHPLDEPMAAHVNCRCTMLPVPISWNELLGVTGIPEPKMPETGMAWFERQGPLTKLKMMGPSRYFLYQSGIPLSTMVGERGGEGPWGAAVYIKPLGGFNVFSLSLDKDGLPKQYPVLGTKVKVWKPKTTWPKPSDLTADPYWVREQQKFLKTWGGKPASAAKTVAQAEKYARYILEIHNVNYYTKPGHPQPASSAKKASPAQRAQGAANVMNTQLQRMKDLGYPMPLGVALSYGEYPGDSAIAFYNPRQRILNINMENIYWDGTLDGDEDISELINTMEPWMIPTNRSQIIIHEFGHFMDGQALESTVGQFYRGFDFVMEPDIEYDIQELVSPYAATSQAEFIAESFTFQQMGGTLPQNLSELYNNLQGPPILVPGEVTTAPWPYYSEDQGGANRRESEYRSV